MSETKVPAGLCSVPKSSGSRCFFASSQLAVPGVEGPLHSASLVKQHPLQVSVSRQGRQALDLDLNLLTSAKKLFQRRSRSVLGAGHEHLCGAQLGPSQASSKPAVLRSPRERSRTPVPRDPTEHSHQNQQSEREAQQSWGSSRGSSVCPGLKSRGFSCERAAPEPGSTWEPPGTPLTRGPWALTLDSYFLPGFILGARQGRTRGHRVCVGEHTF